MDNLEEMDNFLALYNLPKLDQEEIENLTRPITSREKEIVIKNFQKNQISRPDGFHREFYQIFKENLMLILLKLFQNIEEEGKLLKSFNEASITMMQKQDRDNTKK